MTKSIDINVQKEVISQTRQDEPKDTISISDAYKSDSGVLSTPSETFTDGRSFTIVGKTITFAIPHHKQIDKVEPKYAVTGTLHDLDVEVEAISQRANLDEAVIIQQSIQLAEKIHVLMSNKEAEGNVKEASLLAKLMSKLYDNLHLALKDRNEILSTRYKMFASFWELRSNF